VAKRSPSILYRIVWLHLLALAAISIAISAAVYFLLNATVDDFEKRMLRDHAASVSQHLALKDGQWSLTLPSDLQAIYAHGYGGYALAVITDNGHVVYSSLPNGSLILNQTDKPPPEFFRQSRGASIYYGITMPVTRNGRSCWIQVGQNLQNPDVIIDDVVALFLGQIVWFVIPIFVVLVMIDIFLMRRLLAPIVAASQVASSISPNRPLRRLPTTNLPREVLPLAVTVNEALERLDSGLRAQREFTADAAHELRTPLAILRTHVDTKLEGEVALALQNDIDAMSHIVDQLLELAELEGSAGLVDERIDLNTLCTDLVSMMAPVALAVDKSLELVCVTEPVWVRGNTVMITHALRNMVENAIRYSKPDSRIEIEVSQPGTIQVKDRGPGIRQTERELIFQRFWRRNRQDREHAGLGLAIVAKIVQLHGGAVGVADREHGGAIFTITLPVFDKSEGTERYTD